MINVLEPSNSRVEPKCPFARKCGGCQIQEMSYEKQLEFKERKVRGNLERIGGFSSELLECTKEPIIGMELRFIIEISAVSVWNRQRRKSRNRILRRPYT